MGDDDYRFACAQGSDRSLDKRLVLGVERGGRLVEEHHGRVFQESPRNGEALALPAREGGAVLAQHRVEPLGKPLDELQAVRRPCSLGHLFVGGAFAADANIVRNRVVEKDHVLEDYGDVREPRFLGEPGDVLARAEDPAAVRLPEFRRQLGAGRLARAARPDERGDSSFLRVEADAVKDLLVAVPEPDALEGQVVAGHIRRGGPPRFGLVHDRLDPGRLGREVEKVGQLRDEGEDGPVDAGDDEQEHEQNHEVDAAGGEKHRPDAGGQTDSRAEDGACKGDGDVDGELDPHRHPLELEHRLLHGGGVLAHRPAGPYVLDAFEVVLHARQRIQADAVLPFEKARLMASAQGDDPRRKRKRDHNAAGEPPVEEGEHHADDHSRHDSGDELRERRGEHGLLRRHVPHDAVGNVGRVPAVEEAHGQLPQVVGEAQADALGLGVGGHVGFLVVVPRGEKDHDRPRDPNGKDRPERARVEGLARKGPHKGRERGDRADEGNHEGQVAQGACKGGALEARITLLGEIERPLKPRGFAGRRLTERLRGAVLLNRAIPSRMNG